MIYKITEDDKTQRLEQQARQDMIAAMTWGRERKAETKTTEFAAAVSRIELLAAGASGASEGARRILQVCFRGNDEDILCYLDLARLDHRNQDAAMILLRGVAACGIMPEKLLSRPLNEY
ncbi:hypothetical protein [Paracoccus luteus]|uniref:hypothetical protein n=1 Tax=Paracoccus luteus TaxID=2508543 RepID=UPI0010702E24|nr:hypothetical protein [Paracoccus luteus]